MIRYIFSEPHGVWSLSLVKKGVMIMISSTLRAAVAAAALLIAPAVADAAPILGGSSISLNGFVNGNTSKIGNATALDFTDSTNTASPGVAGVLSAYGSGTGSFAGVSCATGSCGSILDIASLTVGAQTITNFLSLTGGTNASPITYTLSSIDSIQRLGDFLLFSGSGTFSYQGYDPTPGTFMFTAQGTTMTTFSASTVAAVPEPITWALLIVGMGGIAFSWRRRKKVNFILVG
jgi:hypothetical protein